jgi:adenylate cyclase
MAPDEPKQPTQSDVEELILGGEPRFTAVELAQETGTTLGEARRIWRALGFPEYDPGAVAFPDADAGALALVRRVIDDEVLDLDTAINLTRALGQTMSRLADWDVATLAPRIDPGVTGEEAVRERMAEAMRLINEVGGAFEHLIIYAWRRHLAAALARAEALASSDDETTTTDVTVGFADLVAFTALSNEIGEIRIGDLVEIFESRCHDVVSSQRGRVIKSLGDSVLFVVDDPIRALDIAEGIITVIGRDPRMPDVRIGLASGPVALRMGDVFGPAVNMAARLTGVARRNRTIIDEATAALLPDDLFEVRRLPARPLRGFGLVEPIAVRRL